MVNKLYANTLQGDLPKIFMGCDLKTSEVVGVLIFIKVNLEAKVAETNRGNPLYFWLKSC